MRVKQVGLLAGTIRLESGTQRGCDYEDRSLASVFERYATVSQSDLADAIGICEKFGWPRIYPPLAFVSTLAAKGTKPPPGTKLGTP